MRNLSYSTTGKRGLLDVYLPATKSERRPVLLQVHGGAWMMGHKSEQAQPLLHRMVEMGWVAVSINYRLAPKNAYPAQIIDVKKAISWVKANIKEYGGDPDFVVITGGSAGGTCRCSRDSLPVIQTGKRALRAAIQRFRAYWRCIRWWTSLTAMAFASRTAWMASLLAALFKRLARRPRRSLKTDRPFPGFIVLALHRALPFLHCARHS